MSLRLNYEKKENDKQDRRDEKEEQEDQKDENIRVEPIRRKKWTMRQNGRKELCFWKNCLRQQDGM